MDELILKLVYYLFYGLFVALRFLVRVSIRGVRRFVRWLGDQGSAPSRSPPQKLVSRSTSAPASASSLKAAPAASALASVKYERSLAALVKDAEAEAQRCSTEEQNERFVQTLTRDVVGRAE